MPPPARTRGTPATVRTQQWREWKGVNLTDARVAIEDTELHWLENAVTVGRGAIQILPHEGPAVASVPAGIATLWGVALDGLPVMIAICVDGSIAQVTPAGVVTAVAPAGSVSILAHVTIWQGSPVLFIDPVHGYSSWNGTTYTVIDATLVGASIAVFEGRVWIGLNRTITYSAPNSFNDFTVASGGGNTTITDEAFQGNIIALISVVEQLWIIGQAAIEAIANVQAIGDPPNITTSFSITNIVTNIGSPFPASVIGYFRALVFVSAFAAYALSGVTPQKLSDKLDDLPVSGILGPVPDLPAAVAVIRNFLTVLFLVPYAGTESVGNAVTAPGDPVPLIVGFSQGKWFFGYQGALRWITTLVVGGRSEAWGTDGTRVYRVFGGDDCTPVDHKVVSKLYDFGLSTTEKALMKLGVEWRATPGVTQPTFVATPPEVFAAGLVTTDDELGRSTDGGATWAVNATDPGNAQAWAIEYLGDDIILVGIDNTVDASLTPTIFRSVDRGITWDTGTILPGVTGAVTLYVIRRIGISGVVLAGGSAAGSVGPVLWRSTNKGVTWTKIDPADIVNVSASSNIYKIRDILDLGDGKVVMGLGGRTGVGDVQWRMSLNSGLTFAVEGTLTTANPGDVPPPPWQLARSDDGHVISTGDRDNADNNGVWRGTVNADGDDIAWARVLTTAL